MALDFVMTLDSDDEAPDLEVEAEVVSAAPLQRDNKKRNGKGKKKQEVETKTSNTRDAGRMKKRKRGDEDDGTEAPDALDKSFTFDGLGGGWSGYSVTDKRDAWDVINDPSSLIAKRNALPRVELDDIIARHRTNRPAAPPMAPDGQDLWSGILGGEDVQYGDESDVDEAGSDEEAEASDLEDKEEEDDDDIEEGDVGADDIPVDLQDDGDEVSSETGKGFTFSFAVLADRQDDDEDMGLPEVEETSDEKKAAERKAYFSSIIDASAEADGDGSKKSKKGRDGDIGSSFSSMTTPLSRPLLLSLSSLNLSTPTPVQKECIPVAMMGKDIVASCVTGGGKTVAFWVGVLERLLFRDRRTPATRVLVLCPTRELAVQVHGVGKALARYMDLSFCLCVGGLSLRAQEAELKQRPDIVVSTPGRLIDHVRNTASFSLDSLEILIIDEADRILEEGFRDELEEIIKSCPRTRQTMLFSATITEDIDSLARLSLNKPVRVKIDTTGSLSTGLTQEFLKIKSTSTARTGVDKSRETVLVAVCQRSFQGSTIVFFRSKREAHRMKIIFSLLGLSSAELHGDLTQEQRLKSLQSFKEGKVSYLLATDLASRGLDIKGIENVVNFEMPSKYEIYQHRVGRTARAGRKGRALTLVAEPDRKLVKQAIKSAPPESVKQRVVPADALSKAAKELDNMEAEIEEVLGEETEEKQLRRTEMELKKGQNLIEHADEIKSRPARTWFQTATDKIKAKDAGKDEHNAGFGAESGSTSKRTPQLTHKQKRRKVALEESKADRTDSTINSSIRHAKKAARPGKMRDAGDFDDDTSSKKKKNGGGSKGKGKPKSAGGFGADAGGKRRGGTSAGPSKAQRGGKKGAAGKGGQRRKGK